MMFFLVLYHTFLNDSFTVLLRITCDCHQMTPAAMSSTSQYPNSSVRQGQPLYEAQNLVL